MALKLDARQTISRDTLAQVFPNVSDKELDDILRSLDSEVTPPLVLDASSTPDLTVSIGASIVSNAENSRQKSIKHIGTTLPTFTSGTVLFPATTGGTITVTPGANGTLTVPSNEFVKVLISLNVSGNLTVTVGTANAVEATAAVPSQPDNELAIGYVSLFNNAGTVDNVVQSKIFQFATDAGAGTDTSLTTNIASLQNIQIEGFQNFVKKITMSADSTATFPFSAGTFRSEIVNRADMIDLSQDLQGRLGINRIMTEQSELLQDEFGPAGENVYRITNDVHDQIRLVGSWDNPNGSFGHAVQPSSDDSFVEITFYGTGLNILVEGSAVADWRVKVDDSAEGGATIFPANISNVLGGRNYGPNHILNATKNETLGIHTVRIRRNTTGTFLYGFEILNESTALTVNTGTAFVDGKELTLASQQTPAISSTFESGTLGSKGGHVLTYLKDDNTVAKAVIPTDAAAALTLTNTDHSNEEIIRSYNFREFGAFRSDDFSLLSGSGTIRSFTLDDGTTTLVTSSTSSVGGGPPEGFTIVPGGFFTFTFVGTGLDILLSTSGISRTIDEIFINGGISIGTFTKVANGIPEIKEIVSGLPYGTHTIKFNNPTNVGTIITDFIIYGPKIPDLPTGAVALFDYYIMSDFSFVSDQGFANSEGTLFKSPTREIIYKNTPAISGPNTVNLGGWHVAFTSDNFEYHFTGTGIILRTDTVGTGATGTLAIDDSTDLTSFTLHTLGGITLSTAGVLGGVNTSAQAAVGISGLPYGLHKISSTVALSDFNLEGMELLTSIHSPKSNLPANINATLPVGSLALGDLRKLTPLRNNNDLPNWSQTSGIAAVTTTSTSFIPLPQAATLIKTSGKHAIEVNFEISTSNSNTSIENRFDVIVDGNSTGTESSLTITSSNANGRVSLSRIIAVSKGTHLVQIAWRVTGGTATAFSDNRVFTVKELK